MIAMLLLIAAIAALLAHALQTFGLDSGPVCPLYVYVTHALFSHNAANIQEV